jgi:hypothetical protein
MFDPFAHLNRPMPSYLQELLSISKKNQLRKFAKQIKITRRDFATLVWNAAAIGYGHEIKSREFRPTDPSLLGDWNFDHTEDGKLTPEAIRTVKKIKQIFYQRRMLTAHIFFNRARWHIFYFDQRDMDTLGWNHWKCGPHIHFVNDLWPSYDPQDLWNTLDAAETNIGGCLHIRYDPQQPRASGTPLPLPLPRQQ